MHSHSQQAMEVFRRVFGIENNLEGCFLKPWHSRNLHLSSLTGQSIFWFDYILRWIERRGHGLDCRLRCWNVFHCHGGTLPTKEILHLLHSSSIICCSSSRRAAEAMEGVFCNIGFLQDPGHLVRNLLNMIDINTAIHSFSHTVIQSSSHSVIHSYSLAVVP